MSVGASFQLFRGLEAAEFARAASKDFSQILLCNYRKVLVLFRRRLRRFLGPGFRDVLGFSTVGLAIPDWVSAPIKLWRHRIFVLRARE